MVQTNDIHRDEDLYIRELQTYLRKVATRHDAIPSVAIDGIFGPETTASVTAFQTTFDLSPTGRADRITWNAVYAEYMRIIEEEAPAEGVRPFPNPQHIMLPGDSGNLVFILQIMLDTIAVRYANIPPVEINGHYDEDTVQAVKTMQKTAGLEPDGTTNKDTWNRITRLYNVQPRDELNP